MAARRKNAAGRKEVPPFPKRQMLVLALCRICEPIAFMSIFPYIYYMVKDFNITTDESKISFYAGMVTSAFTFAEFSTGVLWGRLSDKVGRKPILLTGLAGTGISVLLFGFSPNLPVALFARALGGLLNGNIGVLQTTVAELITVKEQQPRAFTMMPLVWCFGSIIGPMIGGALARPVESLPSVFRPGSIWERFPYLLPNLFSAVCVFIGVVIGILFLEETHSKRKHERDRGVELGNYLISRITGTPCPKRTPPPITKLKPKPKPKADEQQPLLLDSDDLPGYRTAEGSPRVASASGPVLEETLDLEASTPTKAAKHTGKTFTRSIMLIIVSYGLLAFHTMTYDALLPVFLSTERDSHKPNSLPFKFSDGFGFDTRTIGGILSVQGLYAMASTLFFFPVVAKRVGTLRLFRLLALTYPLLYIVTPYLVLLPDSLRMTGIYVMVVWKNTYSTWAYPSNALLLTNSAPSPLSLGTINGVAASTASLCRAFGPTVSGLLYSVGLKTGYSGLVWWVTALVTVGGAFISLGIPEPEVKIDEKEEVEEDEDEDEDEDDEEEPLLTTTPHGLAPST